jgi:heme/copper-type cytochrome/quinol oxidase subunit 2
MTLSRLVAVPVLNNSDVNQSKVMILIMMIIIIMIMILILDWIICFWRDKKAPKPAQEDQKTKCDKTLNLG